MKKIIFVLFFVIVQAGFSQWEACNNGMDAKYIISIATKGNNVYVGTAGDGLFISTNNGNSWSAKNTGLICKYPNDISFSNNNIFLLDSGLFMSSNNCNNWISKNYQFSYVSISSLTTNGTKIFVSDPNSIYLSTDNGNSWNIKGTGLGNFDQISFLVSNDSNIFAGTWEYGLYLSTNNGDFWSSSNNGLIYYGLTSVAFGKNIVYAGSYWNGLFASTDNGNSWNKINFPREYYIENLATLDNYLFMGANDGVYIVTKNNNNFVVIDTGLVGYDIISLKISNNYIFAGTYYSGIYRAKLSDFGITNVQEPQKNDNQLNIFPNPASDNLTISIPNNYITNKIEIINLLGTKVLDCESQGQNATINIESLSKGVYFIKIDNETKMFVKE